MAEVAGLDSQEIILCNVILEWVMSMKKKEKISSKSNERYDSQQDGQIIFACGNYGFDNSILYSEIVDNHIKSGTSTKILRMRGDNILNDIANMVREHFLGGASWVVAPGDNFRQDVFQKVASIGSDLSNLVVFFEDVEEDHLQDINKFLHLFIANKNAGAMIVANDCKIIKGMEKFMPEFEIIIDSDAVPNTAVGHLQLIRQAAAPTNDSKQFITGNESEIVDGDPYRLKILVAVDAYEGANFLKLLKFIYILKDPMLSGINGHITFDYDYISQLDFIQSDPYFGDVLGEVFKLLEDLKLISKLENSNIYSINSSVTEDLHYLIRLDGDIVHKQRINKVIAELEKALKRAINEDFVRAGEFLPCGEELAPFHSSNGFADILEWLKSTDMLHQDWVDSKSLVDLMLNLASMSEKYSTSKSVQYLMVADKFLPETYVKTKIAIAEQLEAKAAEIMNYELAGQYAQRCYELYSKEAVSGSKLVSKSKLEIEMMTLKLFHYRFLNKENELKLKSMKSFGDFIKAMFNNLPAVINNKKGSNDIKLLYFRLYADYDQKKFLDEIDPSRSIMERLSDKYKSHKKSINDLKNHIEQLNLIYNDYLKQGKVINQDLPDMMMIFQKHLAHYKGGDVRLTEVMPNLPIGSLSGKTLLELFKSNNIHVDELTFKTVIETVIPIIDVYLQSLDLNGNWSDKYLHSVAEHIESYALWLLNKFDYDNFHCIRSSEHALEETMTQRIDQHFAMRHMLTAAYKLLDRSERIFLDLGDKFKAYSHLDTSIKYIIFETSAKYGAFSGDVVGGDRTLNVLKSVILPKAIEFYTNHPAELVKFKMSENSMLDSSSNRALKVCELNAKKCAHEMIEKSEMMLYLPSVELVNESIAFGLLFQANYLLEKDLDQALMVKLYMTLAKVYNSMAKQGSEDVDIPNSYRSAYGSLLEAERISKELEIPFEEKKLQLKSAIMMCKSQAKEWLKHLCGAAVYEKHKDAQDELNKALQKYSVEPSYFKPAELNSVLLEEMRALDFAYYYGIDYEYYLKGYGEADPLGYPQYQYAMLGHY